MSADSERLKKVETENSRLKAKLKSIAVIYDEYAAAYMVMDGQPGSVRSRFNREMNDLLGMNKRGELD